MRVLRAARVLLERRAAALGFGVSVSVMSLCCLALPILGVVYTRLCGSMLAGVEGRPEPQYREARGTGAWLVAALYAVAMPTCVAVWTLDESLPVIPGRLASLGVAALFGALVSPVLLVPFAGVDPSAAPRDAFVRGLFLASRFGLLRLAAWSALAYAVLALPIVIGVPSRHLDTFPVGLTLGALLSFLTTAYACALLATIYVDARGHEERAPAARSATLRGAARALLLACVPVLLLVASSFCVVLATPAPLQCAPTVGRSAAVQQPVGPLRIEGTSTTVTPIPNGLRVTTDDGGGAGDIVAPSLRGLEPHISSVRSADSVYTVEARVTTLDAYPDSVEVQRCVVHLDSHGVRLDDDFPARLTARTGPVKLTLFVVLCAALLGLFWSVGLALARARYLDDGPGHDALTALAGTLRLEGAGEVTLDRDAEVVGDVWLDTASGPVRLSPGRYPLLVRADVPRIPRAVRVTVVGRFARAQAASLRTSELTVPPGARLVLGGRDEAAGALAGLASTRATRLSVVLIVSSLALSWALLAGC